MGWWNRKPKAKKEDLKIVEDLGGDILEFIDDKMEEVENDEEVEEQKIDGIQRSLCVYVMTEMLEPFDVADRQKIMKEVAKVYEED